jgi:endonuclease-3
MTEEKLKERKKRVSRINLELKKLFPRPRIALKYKTNWELLVAVVLSAQCTDKKVDEVTKVLFRKYKKFDDYVSVEQEVFEKDIRPTGFYRNKAKNILSSAKIVKQKFGGRVPNTMEEILTLPGIARKSANIILSNAYGVVEGIAVDTHVRRLAIKFGLTDNLENTDKIEADLMAILPKKEWSDFTYRLIEYGREICPRRIHNCTNHPITKLYKEAANIWP